MLQSPNELGPRAALLQHYNVVKQHTVVETQVSSKKGLCVQQREVNDAAMVLHSVYKARMFM